MTLVFIFDLEFVKGEKEKGISSISGFDLFHTYSER